MSEIDRVQIDIGLDQIILLAVGANFYRWGSILLLAFPLAAGSETMLLFALVEMPVKRATRLGKCAELCSLFRAS